eukprot:gene7715-8554_t
MPRPCLNHPQQKQKPTMTYSESVKQAKPRLGSSPSNEVQKTSQKTSMVKAVANVTKEQNELDKAIDLTNAKLAKAKSIWDGRIAEKKQRIRDLIDQINDNLLLLKPVYCTRKNCKHDQPASTSCVPAYKKISELNEKMTRKVYNLRGSINKLKESIFIARQAKERKRDIVGLFHAFGGEAVKNYRKYHHERYHEKLAKEANDLEDELARNEELCASSGPKQAEKFMKNCIKTLSDNVSARLAAISDMEAEIKTRQDEYEHQRSFLNALQDETKKMKKELSEPIINRVQYNLCLKENVKYNHDLAGILQERDAVQHMYGAAMEEFKMLECQLRDEENSKEKLFMDIMRQLEEKRNIELEHEAMVARINQMHAEIAVRHGFIHAKRNMVEGLSADCEKLNRELLVSVEEEGELKRENKSVSEGLTDTLFDVCFSMSWMEVGEEMESQMKDKNDEQ